MRAVGVPAANDVRHGACSVAELVPARELCACAVLLSRVGGAGELTAPRGLDLVLRKAAALGTAPAHAFLQLSAVHLGAGGAQLQLPHRASLVPDAAVVSAASGARADQAR